VIRLGVPRQKKGNLTPYERIYQGEDKRGNLRRGERECRIPPKGNVTAEKTEVGVSSSLLSGKFERRKGLASQKNKKFSVSSPPCANELH